LVCIYSLVQAVAAIQANVSVLQVNIGRINEWYDRHPGVVRDPTGPREVQAMAMAGYGGPLENPGLPLVKKIYSYCHNHGGKTKVIASGMRTKKEALSLAGCDYLVVGPQVLRALRDCVTLEGYNDGLHAAERDFESIQPAMSPELAASTALEKIQQPISKEQFEHDLGMMGVELLQSGLERTLADARRLEPILMNSVGGQE